MIDAEGQVLGRLAVEIARLLRGKHKPQYTPYLDCGDHVVVVNADKIRVTGNKAMDKMYYRHSGYPGGLRELNYERMMEKHPTRALELAVKGMLPTIGLAVGWRRISASTPAAITLIRPSSPKSTR